jgi:hypothetical protein
LTKITVIIIGSALFALVTAFAIRAQVHRVKDDSTAGGYAWFVRSNVGRALEMSSLHAQLRGLERPRGAEDVPPEDVATLFARVARPLGAGGPRFDQSRLLLRQAGQSAGELYALPTSRGWVCYATTDGIARCVSELGDGVSWTIEASRKEPAVFVHGLLANDIRDVVVVLRDGSAGAAAGNNAFYARVANAAPDDVIGLQVTYTDGGVRTIELR